MVQAAHDGDLALDVGHQADIGKFPFVDDLNGDALSSAYVTGMMNLGEGATTQEPAELVFIEQGVFWNMFELGHRW
ncbi:hypothetical protein F3Y22_tig00110300pilonHSYRG00019 [Hibiscus syriacus]|uniref:Uncharacterized protein n=1 Tax=Hibiscus syriacus TaxID=106335 RepID=A0A6A3B5R6_HIBSY|nr:hypothetical protein F3Y22_tig00110300pilonHSYRG00019 [Hibiscus syriacus]